MLPNLDADCDDNWLSLDVILANIPLYVTGKASVTELLLEWVNGFSRIEILHKNALRPLYIKLLNVLNSIVIISTKMRNIPVNFCSFCHKNSSQSKSSTYP